MSSETLFSPRFPSSESFLRQRTPANLLLKTSSELQALSAVQELCNPNLRNPSPFQGVQTRRRTIQPQAGLLNSFQQNPNLPETKPAIFLNKTVDWNARSFLVSKEELQYVPSSEIDPAHPNPKFPPEPHPERSIGPVLQTTAELLLAPEFQARWAAIPLFADLGLSAIEPHNHAARHSLYKILAIKAARKEMLSVLEYAQAKVEETNMTVFLAPHSKVLLAASRKLHETQTELLKAFELVFEKNANNFEDPFDFSINSEQLEKATPLIDLYHRSLQIHLHLLLSSLRDMKMKAPPFLSEERLDQLSKKIFLLSLPRPHCTARPSNPLLKPLALDSEYKIIITNK